MRYSNIFNSIIRAYFSHTVSILICEQERDERYVVIVAGVIMIDEKFQKKNCLLKNICIEDVVIERMR